MSFVYESTPQPRLLFASQNLQSEFIAIACDKTQQGRQLTYGIVCDFLRFSPEPEMWQPFANYFSLISLHKGVS